MKTVFLRVLDVDDKAAALQEAIQEPYKALGRHRFELDVSSFASVPGSPFAYWVSERLRRLFAELPSFESQERKAKHGAATLDDIRFVRMWTEVNESTRWVPFAKGGSNSPFYADIHLVLKWSNHGEELKANASAVRSRNGWGDQWTAVLNGYSYYFRPGLTWPHRSATFSAAALPAGCVFSQSGKAAFVPDSDLGMLLALFNASVITTLSRVQSDAVRIKFEVGLVERTPYPRILPSEAANLARLGRSAWSLKRSGDTRSETSHAFTLPALLQVVGTTLAVRTSAWQEHFRAIQSQLATIQTEIDKRCFDLYGLDEADQRSIIQGASCATDEIGEVANDDADLDGDTDDSRASTIDAMALATQLLSWAFGVSFGRFDVRLAIGARPLPAEPDPFAPLPTCSPGMLKGNDDLAVAGTPSGYPLPFPGNGVLVDDSGVNEAQPHADDIVRRVREVLTLLWGDKAHEIEQELCDIVRVSTLRDYFRKPTGFFQDHLKRYSKSRRKAPIYWPLCTESGKYTLWLYYPRLSDQTLYACVNDHLDPKLRDIEKDLERLRSVATPDRKVRQDMDELGELQIELKSLRKRLLEIAALPYKPNPDDGVLISAAPLWQLFRNGAWRGALKKCWEDLNEGKYDWAHLAYLIWPERVRQVCTKDKSVALAHGLGDLYKG